MGSLCPAKVAAACFRRRFVLLGFQRDAAGLDHGRPELRDFTVLPAGFPTGFLGARLAQGKTRIRLLHCAEAHGRHAGGLDLTPP